MPSLRLLSPLIAASAAWTLTLPVSAGSSTNILQTDGAGVTSWVAKPAGTVTSVAQSFTGGLISVGGSPVTSSGTLALTVAGTSGGIPYFSGASTWASSAALAVNALVVGGGAGVAPATVTTGANILTALGVAVGSAGAPVINGGVLGTPSSGTLTNCSGLPIAGIASLGTNVATLMATGGAVANGFATLGGSGKLTAGQVPSAMTGATVYQGAWNANTNSPTIVRVASVFWAITTLYLRLALLRLMVSVLGLLEILSSSMVRFGRKFRSILPLLTP